MIYAQWQAANGCNAFFGAWKVVRVDWVDHF